MYIRDAMTTQVLTVGPETPLKEVALLLVEHRISGVPVVDQDGRLLGVVSEADFLTKDAGPPERRRRPLAFLSNQEGRAALNRVRATTAGEAMTAPAVSIGPDRPLGEAAMRMERSKINRLPVVEDGRVVGIVTRADIVRAYARDDAELATIVRESLRAVDGLRVVAVRDGVAVLAGTVATQTLAETARRVAERIDGIVAVDDSDVAWLEPRPDAETWQGSMPPPMPG